MGLFNNKTIPKNDLEEIQTNEIKSLSQTNSSENNTQINSQSSIQQTSPIEQTNNPNTEQNNIQTNNNSFDNNFVNPFSNSNQKSLPITPQQTNNNNNQFNSAQPTFTEQTQTNSFESQNSQINQTNPQSQNQPLSFEQSQHNNNLNQNLGRTVPQNTNQNSMFNQTPNTPQTATPFQNNHSTMANQDQIQNLIDETVEKVIAEKWEKIVSNVEKVVKWKDKIDMQMNLVKTDLVDMKTSLEKVEGKILEKVESYDKNILDVNSEIRALEKVFQKITPTLINNVNELSKIAEDFKTTQDEKTTKTQTSRARTINYN